MARGLLEDGLWVAGTFLAVPAAVPDATLSLAAGESPGSADDSDEIDVSSDVAWETGSNNCFRLAMWSVARVPLVLLPWISSRSRTIDDEDADSPSSAAFETGEFIDDLGDECVEEVAAEAAVNAAAAASIAGLSPVLLALASLPPPPPRLTPERLASVPEELLLWLIEAEAREIWLKLDFVFWSNLPSCTAPPDGLCES